MIKFSDEENKVLCNIIGACESGGMAYGNRDYAAFAEAYENTSNETAITLGWAQNYGPEARELLLRIQKADPSGFAKLDTAGIATDLKASDWSNYQIKKTSTKAKCIIKIITSDSGKKCQDQLFADLCQTYINYAESLGVTDHMLLAECINTSHQGGTGATKRVLSKTAKPWNIDNFYAALNTDPSPGNYVGSYKNRQKCVYNWIKQYWPKEESSTNSNSSTSTNNTGGNNMAKTYPAGYIANSGHDENNSYAGGRAGDQTSGEWEVRTFYSRPWDCILRYPDAKARATAARLGIDAANNDHIGYDQYQRTTFWQQLTKVDYEPSKITVDCEQDCSAGVSAIWKAVGYLMNIQALKNISEDNWTGSMKSAFRTAGFEVLTASKYLTSADYLLAGDVLLNESHHAALCISSGSKSGEESSNSSSSQNNAVISDSASGSLNDTVKSYLYAKKDDTKLRTWGGESSSQLVSYPTVSKGTKLGLCDSIKVDGRDWYFVKISGSKGDKFGFVDSYDVSNNINDIQNNGNNVVVSGVSMTLSNGKTFNTSKKKWTGKVTTNGDTLNFRTWAGTDSAKLKSIPEIPNKEKVAVYDAILADDGSVWLYVKYNSKWGFVSANYITKV